MAKGWTNESARHSMSRYGIKTGRKSQFTPKRVGKKYMLIDNNTKQFLIGYSFDSKKDAEAFPNIKNEAREKTPDIVFIENRLDQALKEIDEGSNKVAIEKLNEIKREIRANGELNFMEMDGRTMAFSILSDAQESLNYGSNRNAILFINQAKDLLKGNFKKEGHEVIFPNGESAIF